MPGVQNAIARLLAGVAVVANTAGTVVVIGLVLVLNYDVIARGLFHSPFLGAVEVVQFSVVLIVFLQLPDVVRVGRLTRSDGFLLLLSHRQPKVGSFARRLCDFVAAIFTSLIAIAMWPEFFEAWETGDFFGIPGVFVAPWWPIKLVILFSAIWCTGLFLMRMIMDANIKTDGKPDEKAKS